MPATATKCASGNCPYEAAEAEAGAEAGGETAASEAAPTSQGGPPGKPLSPVGYAVAGAVGGWVVSAFFGVSPLLGAGVGGAGGYFYGRSRS